MHTDKSVGTALPALCIRVTTCRDVMVHDSITLVNVDKVFQEYAASVVGVIILR